MVKTAFVLECHMALLGNLACYARVPYGTLGSERVNTCDDCEELTSTDSPSSSTKVQLIDLIAAVSKYYLKWS